MQSYDAYEPCGSCQRHVKREDPACPFCGTARTPAASTAPSRRRNVSRAHWLAFGSTLLGMGCNGALGSSGGEVSGGASPDGSTAVTAPASSTSAGSQGGQDASLGDDSSTVGDDASTVEAAAEASPWGPPDASCPRSGTFACGASACDRATQFCGSLNGLSSCQQLSVMTNLTSVLDGGTCGSCPTCACVPPTDGIRACTCFEDNLGGLTITCSQGGCYGSPPARLDRAPLRV